MTCLDFKLWDKNLTRPKIPVPVGTFVPLYPICLMIPKENAYSRVWFWLWECTVCKKERIMAADVILYDECICDPSLIGEFTRPKRKRKRTPRISKYPVLTPNSCQYCGKMFTYNKTSTAHVIKYCCKEHESIGRVATRVKAVSFLSSHKIKEFDRLSVCTRKPTRFLRFKCANYDECQEHRIQGEYGPYYKEDHTCYTPNSIEDSIL